jgi:hypothetical protein
MDGSDHISKISGGSAEWRFVLLSPSGSIARDACEGIQPVDRRLIRAEQRLATGALPNLAKLGAHLLDVSHEDRFVGGDRGWTKPRTEQ